MPGSSIIDDLRYRFNYGNVVTRLIFINVFVFLFFGFITVIEFFAQAPFATPFIMKQMALPAALPKLLYSPWSVLTYMFFHTELTHIFFNMLWLYWFGEIFVLYLGDKKILPLYILGGVAGALLYLVSYNTFNVFSSSLPHAYMLGASASILAIVFAAATLNPDHEINLLLIGRVSIKYVALVPLLIDIISIPKGNPGGYIAHVGGAFCGWLFIKALRRGVDPAKPIGQFAEMVASQFKKDEPKSYGDKKVIYGGAFPSSINTGSNYKTEEEQLNEILDKMNRSGHDSLTKEERDFLFKLSNKK